MIKILACIFMLSDHIGRVFFPDAEFLQAAGRIAFPLFAYCVALGIRHTSDSGRYFLRLLLFALIAEPFHFLLFPGRLNILFTFAMIVLLFHLYRKNRLFSLLMCIPVLYLHKYYGFGYGIYGFLTVLIFYAFEGKLLFSSVFFVALNVLFISFGFFGLDQINSIWALLFIPKYTEYRPMLNKYFYYAFYPAHLALFVLIRGLL